MNKASLVEPHGGSLVDLPVDQERSVLLKDIALNLPDITLNDRQLCDFEMLATGAFSPLDGFMTRSDYESVLDRMRLQSGILWPLPVCLSLPDIQARTLDVGQSVTLRDPEGFLLGIMHIEDIWPLDHRKEASRVYGTTDRTHQGVNYLFNNEGNHYVGGKLEVLSLPLHFDFKQLRMSPREVRSIYHKLGWQRVVGFQTRNPIQRLQFEMTIRAMRQAKTNLLLLPITGMTKPGDFDHYTRVRCYRAVTRHYPPDSFVLNLLPLSMRLAGPRDALLHMIIAKNYGCTHLIVGRDHASPGSDANGKPFYESHAARELAEEYSQEIGVTVVPFQELVYLPFEDEYRPANQVPEGTQTISFSSSHIRDRIRAGRRIPEWATFPEVIAELRKAYPSPRQQGFTIFLTGLSGAGKSTIAKVLYARFLEIGDRPVTLLDGDIVRRHLSNLLNFSKEHRDVNVRRIGFVAGEITKNRGIAICAPIAPYNETRAEIRKTIENYGGFFELHVSTPIEVCEKRDRKGMYAKARAGLIKGFTGVDDPYEIPKSPELRIDTTALTPDEAAQEVLLLLGQKGYI
ncbi:MAG: bifunctional sulfate adenylyltransferase/adenylylsulfate kinase [Desulfobacterales bacterium]|uniref:Adenylyl-sulfate kinase n=1 Tax=Candidatus Desulfatibia vada TaxID=2841696 RepID=A0A8J6P4J2_9BACT|nr:bifunctional sulfate adenylyltransferase/adenylylsulfate kinase [Candidatus Desulfatibia vada]MBL6971492.1 bifunctional sulfate adenylyltransferase/adenylylsulfate kinase [Desulfobacterales bacterium]